LNKIAHYLDPRRFFKNSATGRFLEKNKNRENMSPNKNKTSKIKN